MIGAILSNTPASILKGSGVAADRDPGLGHIALGRDGESARVSEASPRAAAIRAGNPAPLTGEAVLALQEGDGAAGTAARAPKDEAIGGGEAEDGETKAASTAGDAEEAIEQPAVPGPRTSAEEQGEKEEDPDGDGLDQSEEQQVEKLKQRDREVRAHEQAHAMVGGAYASAPSYTYQQGPDGKRYAIGGEVQIDTSKERTPEATIRKMQVVIRAATAPAEPSSQDMRVAQQAQAQLAEAQAELRQQKTEELSGSEGEKPGPLEEAAGRTADTGPGTASPDGSNNDDRSPISARKSAEAASVYQAALERMNGAGVPAGSLIA